jgi:hypothetical protein
MLGINDYSVSVHFGDIDDNTKNTVFTLLLTTVFVFIVEKILVYLFDTIKGKRHKR